MGKKQLHANRTAVDGVPDLGEVDFSNRWPILKVFSLDLLFLRSVYPDWAPYLEAARHRARLFADLVALFYQPLWRPSENFLDISD